MNPQEAAQAQTIEQIKKRHEVDCHWVAIYGSSQLRSDLSEVISIVDSQAQKIARQEREINLLWLVLKEYWNATPDEPEHGSPLWKALNDLSEFDTGPV